MCKELRILTIRQRHAREPGSPVPMRLTCILDEHNSLHSTSIDVALETARRGSVAANRPRKRACCGLGHRNQARLHLFLRDEGIGKASIT